MILEHIWYHFIARNSRSISSGVSPKNLRYPFYAKPLPCIFCKQIFKKKKCK